MAEMRKGGQPEGLAPLSGSTYSRRVDEPDIMTAVESRQESRASQHPADRRAVRVYIDGFNLYHAVANLNDNRLKWLNFWKMSETFLRPDEYLDEVNFFTAVLTWDHGKQQRHENFLAACEAVGVRIHRANFKKAFKRCTQHDRECKFFEEKQTDVAIAIKMVADAVSGAFSRAILITADSDQIPTAKFIAGIPGRQLTLVFPPNRKSVARELSAVVADRLELAPGRLLTCRLPRTVHNKAGKPVAHMPAIYHP